MKRLSKFLLIVALVSLTVPGVFGQNCKGMTWVVKKRIGDYVRVGSDRQTNPYTGDTSCNVSLPILAVKAIDAERPPLEGVRYDYYQGWCKGLLRLTPPVKGSRMTSLQEANRIIREYLGPGWRMAEHHDGGGGWSYWGIGTIAGNTRFWVYINDQGANPWNPGTTVRPRKTRPKRNRPPKPALPGQPVNLTRLKSTRVAAGSVNGDRPQDDSHYGVLNLFDNVGCISRDKDYETWLSNRAHRHWIKVKFAGPVTLSQVMVEFVYPDTKGKTLGLLGCKTSAEPVKKSNRDFEWALDITIERRGKWTVEKLPALRTQGFRSFFPLPKTYKNVVGLLLVFPGYSMLELSEIEVTGIPETSIPMEVGYPAIIK